MSHAHHTARCKNRPYLNERVHIDDDTFVLAMDWQQRVIDARDAELAYKDAVIARQDAEIAALKAENAELKREGK